MISSFLGNTLLPRKWEKVTKVTGLVMAMIRS